MENYLIDRETLGKFIDQLIIQKHPNQSPSSLEGLRESSIKKLDDQISTTVFEKLDGAQLDEINTLLDKEESTPTTFQVFFKNAGINIEQVVIDAMTKFSQEFLGGENA